MGFRLDSVIPTSIAVSKMSNDLLCRASSQTGRFVNRGLGRIVSERWSLCQHSLGRSEISRPPLLPAI